MKWPFVSRAKYEAMGKRWEEADRERSKWERWYFDATAAIAKMTAREEEARQEREKRAAARRAQRAAKRVTIDMADATADTATGEPTEPRKPDPIAQAIRAVAGQDKALARHLRAFADEARSREVPERDIVKAIRTGQEVRV
jgi:hypothetical protein